MSDFCADPDCWAAGMKHRHTRRLLRAHRSLCSNGVKQRPAEETLVPYEADRELLQALRN